MPNRAKPSFPRLNRSHPLAQGLVFCPPLHEGSGLISTDTVNNVVGTLRGTNKPTWVSTPYGYGVKFGATGTSGATAEAIDYGNSLPLRVTSCTVAVLCRVTVLPSSEGRLLMKERTGNLNPFQDYGLYVNSTGKAVMCIATGGSGTLTQSISLSSISAGNTWYFIVGTYDQANIRLYFNGALETTTVKTGAINTNGANLYMGADVEEPSATMAGLNGQIAFAAVWNRPMSPQEIAQLSADPFQIYQRRKVLRVI